MAQSVKHPTLDFGSGHDLMVRELEPHIGLGADRAETAWDSLSLCSSPTCGLSLSLSQKKKKKSEEEEDEELWLPHWECNVFQGFRDLAFTLHSSLEGRRDHRHLAKEKTECREGQSAPQGHPAGSWLS